MTFQDRLQTDGAVLAPDGIPIHFGDLAAEYDAALNGAVLLVRSHEGRLVLTGRDRLSIIHRISTNDVERLQAGQGCPTIFVNPTGRILDRATLYHQGERVLVIGEPGRGPALASYLRGNIFFNDELQIEDIAAATHQFAMHGPRASAVIARLTDAADKLEAFGHMEASIDGVSVTIARNKPLSGTHWTIVVPADAAAQVWSAILEAGREHGLLPAGSLTFNTLRIRAGRPAIGRELSPEYIPLEVGLWDEVSFNKGCYTGQEIIARMESRGKLARVMVRLRLEAPVEAPADLFADGRAVGRLTSSATSPRNEHFGIGVIKTATYEEAASLSAGTGSIPAQVIDLAGAPPPMLA